MLMVDRRVFITGAAAVACYPIRALSQSLTPPPQVIAAIAAAPKRQSLVVSAATPVAGQVMKAKNCVMQAGSSLVVQDLRA